MRFSSAFIPTLKEVPKEATQPSHALLLRGGFVRMVGAGLYDMLPLGVRVVRKVTEVVRREMDAAGAQEMLLPALLPATYFKESGRWESFGPELIRLQDRRRQDYHLGPTHEEIVTDLVRRSLSSYRQLPFTLYQVQTKFRDEPRPRGGLLRCREFLMKDAYSFDQSEEAGRSSYDNMRQVYERIFDRLGLDYRVVQADSGAMGGSLSAEFQILAQTGEDALVACAECSYAANVEVAGEQKDCPSCGASLKSYRGIEGGHIFLLGTHYSKAMSAQFLDPAGNQTPVVMGCYGIGISRLVAAAIEQHHDDAGIVWPLSMAPYHVIVTPLGGDEVLQAAEGIYQTLIEQGVDAMLDDRSERPGAKFKDADLIGFPIRVTVGKRGLAEGKVELKRRTEPEAVAVAVTDAAEAVIRMLNDDMHDPSGETA